MSEGPRARALRAVAIVVFAATAFLPLHACGRGSGRIRSAEKNVPAFELARPLQRVPDALDAVWRARTWYPYLLVPAWAGALLLAETGGPRRRRAAGLALLALSAAVAVLEHRYVHRDFVGFLPEGLRTAERWGAWLVVVAILFARRRGRGLLEPEAAVSAQALLFAFHALTFPADSVRAWATAGQGAGAVAARLFEEYLPAFWVAVAALFAAALPGYARPRPLHAPVAAPPSPAPAPG